MNQMRSHNGGEGWVGGGAYLRLWPIDDLIDRNRTLEAELLVPGFVLIGSDGAGNLYAIEPATGSYAIFPAIGLDSSQLTRAGESWSAFLQTLAQS